MGFEPTISAVTGRRFKPAKLQSHVWWVSPIGRYHLILPTAQFRVCSRHNPPEKLLIKSLGITRPCWFSIELGCSGYNKPSKVRGTVSVRVPPQDLITRSVSSSRLRTNLKKMHFTLLPYIAFSTKPHTYALESVF